MTRHLVVALALGVAVGGLWVWRELRTAGPAATPAAVGARSDGAASASSRPQLPAGAAGRLDGDAATGTGAAALPPPLGGERGWTTAPAPADGPDPFAPVTTIRTEADTRVGLDP